MFGALTVHGIIPGPRLFTERGDIVYTFMIGLLLTVFAMLIVGLVSIRWSSLIVRAPRRMMVPGVLVLSMIGTYGLDNSLFDVYVLLVVGIVSYILGKLDVPIVTIALGLVLGGLMEESFQQAALVGQVDAGSTWMYFATRPIAIVLMLVAFAVMGAGVLQILRDRRAAVGGAPVESDVGAVGPNLRVMNIVLGAVLVALGLYIFIASRSFSAIGARFPVLVAGAFLVLGGFLLAVNLYPKTGALRAKARPFASVPWRLWLTVVGMLVLFALGTDQIGFYESAFLFLFATCWLLSGAEASAVRRLAVSAVFALGVDVFVYAAFKIVLQIPTPPGLLV